MTGLEVLWSQFTQVAGKLPNEWSAMSNMNEL